MYTFLILTPSLSISFCRSFFVFLCFLSPECTIIVQLPFILAILRPKSCQICAVYSQQSMFLFTTLTFYDPTSLSSQNIPLRHLIPTLTFYPARIVRIDLYPSSDVNRVLRAVKYIRSLRSPVFTGAIYILFFIYVLVIWLEISKVN